MLGPNQSSSDLQDQDQPPKIFSNLFGPGYFFSLVIVLPAAGRDWSYTDSLVKGCGNGAAGMNRRAGTLGTSGIQSGCV